MSNETFLIPIEQNNKLSKIALAQLRLDLDEHPLNQRQYVQLAGLAGNSRKYNLDQVATNTSSPLYGKHILFLGSSVTFGFGALAESFVDDLWKKDGVIATKDAENGTTLVEKDRYNQGDSYVARFKEDLKRKRPEAFVLQLSTNDAQTHQQLGKIEKSGHNFDTQTILGALQYMVWQARKKWACPVLLYTNPDFGDPFYGQMVEKALILAKQEDFAVLDLYHELGKASSSLYMADLIHPTRAGYLKIWTPLFEQKLSALFNHKE